MLELGVGRKGCMWGCMWGCRWGCRCTPVVGLIGSMVSCGIMPMPGWKAPGIMPTMLCVCVVIPWLTGCVRVGCTKTTYSSSSFNEVLNLCGHLDLKKSKITFSQHILACDDVSSNKVQRQKDLKFRRCCPAKYQLKFLPFTVTFTLNRTRWKLWLMMIYQSPKFGCKRIISKDMQSSWETEEVPIRRVEQRVFYLSRAS